MIFIEKKNIINKKSHNINNNDFNNKIIKIILLIVK